jgi:hypothetical protein
MNTLRQVSAFVGGSNSMRRVGDIVPLLSQAQRTSMRSMILGLKHLPPISLEAEAVGDRFGDAPFSPVFRVRASSGVTLDTTIILWANGPQKTVTAKVGEEGDFKPFRLDFPGIYLTEVRRTGITSTGVEALSKSWHVEAVEKPPPPPAPPAPPAIAVKSNGDGSFLVTGSGFLPSHTVHILVGDGTIRNPLSFVDTSTSDGKLLGFPTGKICQAPGSLFFSANDERLDPRNHSSLSSNTVQVSCPL